MSDKLLKYISCRPMMQTGDLLQYRSKSCLGWLIRLFTGHEVNHSGLVVRIKEHENRKDRRWTLEALESGIVLHLLSRRLTKDFKGEAWWYPLLPEFDAYRDAIGGWAFSKVGVGYDYWGLLKQAAARVAPDARRFWCSEFCYFAYKEVAIPIPEFEHGPRPGDMPKLNIFGPRVQIM